MVNFFIAEALLTFAPHFLMHSDYAVPKPLKYWRKKVLKVNFIIWWKAFDKQNCKILHSIYTTTIILILTYFIDKLSI